MNRHRTELYFSLRQIIDNKPVIVNTSNWTDQTPEGFADFVQKNIPNWKQLVVVKNTIVTDLKKKIGKSIVSKKLSTLKIARLDSGEIRIVKVDGNMCKNGEIPQNIRSFFGEHQK